MNLGSLLSPAVAVRSAQWNESDMIRRVWAGDPTVWSTDPATPELANRLGWIRLHETMRPHLGAIDEVAEDVAGSVDTVVLCGMGGSSLAPEVFASTFGTRRGFPELVVCDSTHPAAVLAVRDRIDPERAAFVVSSKSGTTLETLSFFRFFWAETGGAGERFIAVTDPGTPLEQLGRERGFRAVFTADPNVGGRFSALTHFGLVPAALIGADTGALLDSAARLARQAAENVRDDPTVGLGIVLGELARAGKDKLTVLTSPALRAFPAWMEQLIAESLGKDGKGIVPVADEPVRPPDSYWDDRVFFSFNLAGERGADLEALARAGHPVLGFELPEPAGLGYEMLRAEMVTATVGAVFGVHPFDQPNVEAAKRFARAAMDGDLAVGSTSTAPAADAKADLASLLSSVRSGDYVSIQAYLPPSDDTLDRLTTLRARLGEKTRAATTLGWGPRFLHSTGQLHKGGPNTGVFIQLVDSARPGVEVPETGHEFGAIISSQAAGDHQALVESGRRVVRIDLGDDREAGLEALIQATA